MNKLTVSNIPNDGKGQRFSHHKNFWTGSGAPLRAIDVLSLGVKRPGDDADQVPTSWAEIKNE